MRLQVSSAAWPLANSSHKKNLKKRQASWPMTKDRPAHSSRRTGKKTKRRAVANTAVVDEQGTPAAHWPQPEADAGESFSGCYHHVNSVLNVLCCLSQMR